MANCIVVVQFDLPQRTQEQAIKGGTSTAPVYGLLSGHGRLWLKECYAPASHSILEQAIASRSHPPSSPKDKTSQAMIIISRGLAHAEPWAIRYSTIADENLSIEGARLAAELLQHKPDVFITPTVAVYYFESTDDEKQ